MEHTCTHISQVYTANLTNPFIQRYWYICLLRTVASIAQHYGNTHHITAHGWLQRLIHLVEHNTMSGDSCPHYTRYEVSKESSYFVDQRTGCGFQEEVDNTVLCPQPVGGHIFGR